MCSVPGYDASGHVDDLSASQNKQCTSIAIGSAEGFNLAEKAISSASKTGRYRIIGNNGIYLFTVKGSVFANVLIIKIIIVIILFLFFKVGFIKERSFGSSMVGITREEASLSLASR